MKITAEAASRILVCFQTVGIIGEGGQYRTVYRDPNSNFVCNIHNGRKGLTLELQNPASNASLNQLVLAAAAE